MEPPEKWSLHMEPPQKMELHMEIPYGASKMEAPYVASNKNGASIWSLHMETAAHAHR